MYGVLYGYDAFSIFEGVHLYKKNINTNCVVPFLKNFKYSSGTKHKNVAVNSLQYEFSYNDHPGTCVYVSPS